MLNDILMGCIKDYEGATGVRCRWLPLNEKGTEECCTFCEFVKGCSAKTVDCGKTRLYGMYQSETFGGKYIYYCPMGMVHFTSPVTQRHKLIGACFGGPLLMVPREEFLLEDLKPRYGLTAEELNRARDLLNAVPVFTPKAVTSLSNMLYITCRHITEQLNAPSEEDVDTGVEIRKYLGYIETMGGATEYRDYPIHIENRLLSCISVGDLKGSRKLLNELLSYIYLTSGTDYNKFKARILELVVLLSRAAVQGGAEIEQIFGMNYRYLSEIHLYTSFDELNDWLIGILNRFTDCIFNMADIKHVDVMYKATSYIKNNYSSPLTLEEVAKRVYLSSSYFSKIFNREMGENFNSYLNKIRIQNSMKLLLENMRATLPEIAAEVGYGDQSYFTKVFKKIVGVSPGKYRELRGNIPHPENGGK